MEVLNSMPVKVTVNLPDQTVQALKQIAEDRGTTLTEALRQLIETQRYLHEETQNGRQLLIKNPADQTVQQLIFNAPPRVSSRRR